jgi:hypothetical protein
MKFEIKPDKVFVKWDSFKRLRMFIRVIPIASNNDWSNLLISPEIIVFKTNWEILPKTEGEIDEDSCHSLVDEFMKLPIAHFNFYANSGELVPLANEDPIEIAKRAFNILYTWKTDELYKKLLELRFSNRANEITVTIVKNINVFGFNLASYRIYQIKPPVS